MNILTTHTECIFIECELDGRQYQIGEFVQPNCSTRCLCEADGVFNCELVPCDIDGPTCRASGDPHYITWDGRQYDYMGDCEYYLAKPCDNDNFLISSINVNCGNGVSCVDQVRIVIPNNSPREILLSRSLTSSASVTIDGVLQPNIGDTVIISTADVDVVRSGGQPHVILKSEGVRVHYDGHLTATVRVSTKLQGLVCGQCGTYNNDPSDDFQTPEGQLVTSPNVFGESWAVPHCPRVSKRDAPSFPGCDSSATTTAEAHARCNLMLEGSLGGCNAVIDPAQFIADCVFDYCCCTPDTREDCYCSSLSNYAATCTDAGAQPSNWRNQYNCCKPFFNLLIVLLRCLSW